MGLDMVQVSVASTNLCTMTSVRILMVDNRDSFTWNLVHDLGRSGAEVEVRQAGEWDTEDAERFDGIVLSPGPGLPNESPGLMHLVKAWAPHHPILGVCLGLQALVEWSGGGLRQMEQVRHGMQATALRTGHLQSLHDCPIVLKWAITTVGARTVQYCLLVGGSRRWLKTTRNWCCHWPMRLCL